MPSAFAPAPPPRFPAFFCAGHPSLRPWGAAARSLGSPACPFCTEFQRPL